MDHDANSNIELQLVNRSIATEFDLATPAQVDRTLQRLLEQCQANDAAAALVPWFCDALPSPKSRQNYFSDLQAFLGHMRELGVHPFDVNGDHVRLYKEALVQSGKQPGTVARSLAVIRGAYKQFGKQGLVPWNRIADIQAVSAPRVEKNTTPLLSEQEAIRLLHAPDTSTSLGVRDHALLFVYFKTACRSTAIRLAKVGDLERTDTDHFVVVAEKGGKRRRLPLLEATVPVLAFLDAANIAATDFDSPLFPAMQPDRRTASRRHLSQQAVLNIVKKYASAIGLEVSRMERRGICTHSLRKTSANNALQHGARIEHVQQWLGHADIRTTQSYIHYRENDAEAAARRCQIR